MDYNDYRLENRKLDVEKLKIRIESKKVQLDALKERYEIGTIHRDDYSNLLYQLYEDIDKLIDKLVSI